MVERTLARHEDVPAVVSAPPIDRSGLSRREILRVLERASVDSGFIAQLTHREEAALQGYDLTWQDRAALLSGDVRWIEARVGKLTPRLRTWLDCRLQQEKW